MGFPVTVGLNYGDEKITYAANQAGRALGTRGVLPDGKVFRWALAAATAINHGELVQTKADAKASVHSPPETLDVVTVVSGKTTITVTWATTAVTKDFYADGYMNIGTSPGFGQYRVKSNVAAASAAAAEVVLYEDDVLREGTTSGTTKVGFQQNPYIEVIVMPTTKTGAVIGVTPTYVALSRYFWLQTWGPALVMADTAPVAGQTMLAGTASAGGADAATTTSSAAILTTPVIGWSTVAGNDADSFAYVFLTIAA